MSDAFEQLFGKIGKLKTKIDTALASSIWMGKTAIFQKLPKGDDEVIKIKAGDFKRIMRQAYEAGYQRAQLP